MQVIQAKESHAIFIAVSQMAMAFETESGMKLDPETVALGVKAVLNDSSKGKYYVALQNEVPVACLLTIPEWSDWRNGTVLWIHSVFVIKSCRNQGVYKSMYLHLREMMEIDPAIRGLRLYVDKKNTAAQKVYQKLGMSNEHYELYEWMK